MIEHAFDRSTSGLAPHLVAPDALTRQTLPVEPALGVLFPDGGLARGTTVAVSSSGRCGGATSLALATVAAASRSGAWVAFVGLGDLGLAALADYRIEAGRVLVVPEVPAREWDRVLAVLLGAVDVVVVGPPGSGRVPPRQGRRFGTAVREHGAVLLTVGWEVPGFDPAVRMSVVDARWEGVGEGHGHLRARRTHVARSGRGGAARPLRRWFWLPAADGGVEPSDDGATVLTWPGGVR